MACILAGKPDDGTTHINRMEDGEVGVITQWDNPSKIGLAIQRIGDSGDAISANGIAFLGLSWKEHAYLSLCDIEEDDSPRRVRILQPGEKIEVT
jgi:hypothetical protein